jgi:hypothetical protein
MRTLAKLALLGWTCQERGWWTHPLSGDGKGPFKTALKAAELFLAK